MRSNRHSLRMIVFSLHVTSMDGLVHLVPDTVIATCNGGRYVAACGAAFIPAAMTEPDGADCHLCCAGGSSR
jgi:hypothetical protein